MSYDGFVSYSHAADGLLAPRLQAGLQRFAKPWWQRRALRIFRDETSLSANPHLWSSITEALDSSEWFVLLLSPDAAASPWVNQEIEYWRSHKDSFRILPVLTDGTFDWSDGDVSGSAVPDYLRGVFSEEPRWVDLRFAKDEENLDLKDPRFADAVADIASALRGIPKDELASEEVKQHRRTVRTAWGGAALVGVLAIAAVVFGIQSATNARLAEAEAARANQEADRANQEADRAEQEADRANDEADRALTNERLARSRELSAAAISVVDSDPELSILLALEATADLDLAALPIETMVALRTAMYADNLVSRIPIAATGSIRAGAFSPDGRLVALASADSLTFSMRETATAEELWSYHVPDSQDCAQDAWFSRDGSEVWLVIENSVFGGFPCEAGEDVDDGEPARLLVMDADSGVELRRYEVPACSVILIGDQSPDGRYVPLAVQDPQECGLFGSWTVRLSDPVTFAPLLEIPFAGPMGFSWSANSETLVIHSWIGRGAFVYDMTSGELIREIPGVFFAEVDPSATMIASGDFETPVVLIHDLETGQLTDRLTGLADSGPWGLEFLPDGRRLVAGASGDFSAVWDVTTGEVDSFLLGAGRAQAHRYLPGSDELLLLGEDSISRWTLAGLTIGEGEALTLGGRVSEGSTTAPSVIGAGDTGIVLVDNGTVDSVRVFDTRTGHLTGAEMTGSLAWAPAILPDARIVLPLIEEETFVGPVVVWEPVSGVVEPLVGCTANYGNLERARPGQRVGQCEDGREWFDFDRIHTSPSGDQILVTSSFGDLLVFDATSLDLVSEHKIDSVGGVRAFGEDWVIVGSSPTGVQASAQEEFSVIALPGLDDLAHFAGRLVAVSGDGSRVATDTGPGTVTIFDADGWEPEVSFGLGEARIVSLKFSPDGSKVMTAGSDNFVRVWDSASGLELERIPVDSPADAHWLDEGRLVVATSDGIWATFLIDRLEVIRLALEQLSGGFTTDECETYRIDPCPSLEEMRAG